MLLQDHFTRIWYAAFSEGSHAETDWQVGSKAVFTDNSKNGIVGKIIANRPAELLSIEYTGAVIQGVENYTSEGAKKMKGGQEIYRLSEKEGVTELAVECDMDATYFDMMTSAWKKALLKIKEIAETN